MHFDASGKAIRWGLKQTAQPSGEPFTTAEAKLFLRAGDSEDAVVDYIVKAARRRVERDTRRIMTTQTWEYTLDGIPGSDAPIYLPLAPVSAVSLARYDANNVATTVSTDTYRLDTHAMPARLVLNSGNVWPLTSVLRTTSGLIATLTCGYGAAYTAVTDVELLHAVRVLMAHWYENRSAAEVGSPDAPVPFGYDFLIDPLIVPFGSVV